MDFDQSEKTLLLPAIEDEHYTVLIHPFYALDQV
jgi:hypothetical protein